MTTSDDALSIPLMSSLSNKKTSINSGGYGNESVIYNDDGAEYEMSDIGCCLSLKWLLYKNFKQQFMRRPCALICKLLCPAICIIILGLIRMIYPITESSIYYGYDSNSVTFESIQSSSWINDAICSQNVYINNNNNISVSPAWYLGIIPSPSSNKHIAGLIDIMNKTWNYHYNDTQFEEYIAKNPNCWTYAPYIPFKEGWLLRYFDSDTDFNNFLSDDNYGKHKYNITPTAYIDKYKPIGTAFSFDISDDGLIWKWSLRGNTSDCLDVANTDSDYIDIFDRDYYTVFDKGEQYFYSPFIDIQTFIDNSITKYIAKLNGFNNNISDIDNIDNIYKGNGVMPFYEPESDDFWSNLQIFYVFLTIIQFVYPFSQSVSQLIHEKSDKIKEGMKMMGVTSSTYWISWYLWLFIECTIIALLVSGMGVAFKIYKYSDPIIIFIWIELFCINYSCFGVLLSTMFDNSKIASLASFLLFIVLMAANLYTSTMNESQKNAMCLIGPSCFSISTDAVKQYESSMIGIQWNNINEIYNNFIFKTCLIYLFIDCIIYIVLAMYLNKVWPSRYGQREHPLFFISPSFWCPHRNKDIKNIINEASASELKRRKSSAMRYEKCDADNALIKIRDLKKHFTNLFGGGSVVRAVNGISLDIFEGQVFCLLGHNGAGKTTTIGMLTGLLQVTEGNAWINGHSIIENMGAIRKNLGVCPQHDVLFRRLTSKEHLQLFARLKGVPEKYVESEVMKTLQSVGIMYRMNSFPPQMSGGEKRKLSLGIALIGGSKIVFLDEPTSGMDPQSRRITWNLIAKEKKRRCIILTTHFMDEADILGDRIAIMSDGLIRCCGSALFLKRLYGVGYTFTISLNIGIHPKTIKPQIDGIILQNIVGSSCVSVAGAELSYRLPFEETESFPNVFDMLDNKMDEYNIKTYGISITTLEEVFLKIGEMDIQNEGMIESKSMSAIKEHEEAKYNDDIPESPLLDHQQVVNVDDMDKNPFPQPTFQLEGEYEYVIFFRHLFAILYGRFYLAIRDIRSLCCQVLLPAIFALLGLLIIELVFSTNNPKLEMSINQWYSANEYVIPMANAYNVESSEINNKFVINDNYMNFFNNHMSSSFGTMKQVQYENVGQPTDVAESANNSRKAIYNQRSDSKIMQYNAFFAPEILDSSDSNPSIYCIINVTAIHSLPISYNMLNNWILQYRLENVSSSTRPEIIFYSWPFQETKVEKQVTGQIAGIMVSIFLMIALTFIPIGAAYHIVNDRKHLTKHQQLVSGVSCASYWCANYIADFIASLPACLLIWILLHIFDTETFLGDAQGAFVLVLLCFSLSILPFTYLLSNIFQSADKAQVGIGASYIVLGLFLLITSYITDTLPDRQLSQFWKDFLDGVYKIFPTFLMSHALLNIAVAGLGFDSLRPMDWDVAGKDLVIMTGEAVGYFILVLMVEYGLLYKTVIAKWWNKNNTLYQQNDIFGNGQIDDDVINERNRIQQILQPAMNEEGDVNELEHDDGISDYMGNEVQTQIATDTMTADNNIRDKEEYKEGKQQQQQQETDRVIIANLHKVYKPGICCSKIAIPVHAVRGVSLGVKQGEVFGYLGVNGAGKTTTLACLTGERSVTFGNAFVNGYSISNQIAVRRYIGYCPQFDALFDLLTGREHLKFYGRIKGLKGSELTKQVNMLLDVLSLTKYANRRAGTYSGGNKRKLSVAISMIGNPPIVFLDEPSTGMDPMARRSMWEFIRATMSGRCVILTTHSMEECEALCHRLCIMTHGQLKCIGTPQHLKTKFGHGYQLDIQLKENDDDGIDVNKLKIEQQLTTIFNMILIEHNQTKIVYEVTLKNNNNTMTLAQIFRTLEEYKKSLPIQSYALNQTTLEQIFIKMAKQNN